MPAVEVDVVAAMVGVDDIVAILKDKDDVVATLEAARGRLEAVVLATPVEPHTHALGGKI